VVYGSGGTSRDLVECIEAVNEDRRQWNILGFVDDNPNLAGTTVFDYPVLGPAAILAKPAYRHCRIAIGVANVKSVFVRQIIREALNDLPGMCEERLPVILHPTAVVSRRSQIGAGSVMFSGSFCSGNCAVGRHTLVLQGTVISHDSTLGDYVTLCPHVALGGGVQIGNGAFVGSRAVIHPNVKIGQGSLVGFGSVVLRDIADGKSNWTLA
jgi:sugar O-acyltransferase (sialic acid O-acetyltransferase NeuD family)